MLLTKALLFTQVPPSANAASTLFLKLQMGLKLLSAEQSGTCLTLWPGHMLASFTQTLSLGGLPVSQSVRL